MKLMFIASLLLVQFMAGIAPISQSAPPPAAEAAQLLVAVTGGDKGADFLRQAKPTLDRLHGRVLSAKARRNTVLERDETDILLAFDNSESAHNFMSTLAGGGGDDGGATEGSVSINCSNNGLSRICYFRFGNFRFVCVQNSAAIACAQM